MEISIVYNFHNFACGKLKSWKLENENQVLDRQTNGRIDGQKRTKAKLITPPPRQGHKNNKPWNILDKFKGSYSL